MKTEIERNARFRSRVRRRVFSRTCGRSGVSPLSPDAGTQSDSLSGEATFQSLQDSNTEENSAFTPTYDADGNATLIRTSTGTWSVSYNAENRPVRFENTETQTVVECGYDSQGRRFFKKVTVAGTVTLHERYVYRDYLQIAAFDVAETEDETTLSLSRVIFWDPAEPTATRPLAVNVIGDQVYFPTVDLTKNVCELIDFYGNVAATYDYAPFGAVSAGTPSGASVPANPFQWSSEFYDSELDLVYYNYRHYSPSLGRFRSRQPVPMVVRVLRLRTRPCLLQLPPLLAFPRSLPLSRPHRGTRRIESLRVRCESINI